MRVRWPVAASYAKSKVLRTVWVRFPGTQAAQRRGAGQCYYAQVKSAVRRASAQAPGYMRNAAPRSRSRISFVFAGAASETSRTF